MTLPPSGVAALRKVFGPLSHNPPEPSRADTDLDDKQKREAAAIQPSELPGSPVRDAATGIVFVPSARVDGSSADAPWTVPEPIFWDLLRDVEIVGLDGPATNGVFWGTYLNHDGDQRAALLKIDTVGHSQVYEAWTAEYILDRDSHDLLRREQAAYEVAKACGMEDMVAPLVLRAVDVATMMPPGARERIARQERIAPANVDALLGSVAVLQALPKSSENFVEYWGTLGADEVNRWIAATDRLRYSIYRAVALDFLLGIPDRSLSSILYNRNLDSLAIYDLGLSFPHPGFTAEKYLQFRRLGWGRAPVARIEEPDDLRPPHSEDLVHLSKFVQEDLEYECTRTFRQIADGFTNELAYLVGRALLELGIPPESLAGFFARMAFLSADPLAVLQRPAEFVSNVLVPMRRGYGFGEGRNQHVVEYVSSAMSSLGVSRFNFAKRVQDPLPEDATFVV